MIKLSIVTDLDCVLENGPAYQLLRCGTNNLYVPFVTQMTFRSIEFPDLTVNININEDDRIIHLDFSRMIRNKNQTIIGPVMTKTYDPWDFYGLYNLKTNKEILFPKFRQIGSKGFFIFKDKYIEVQDAESYKYGIFSTEGDEIFPFQFEDINCITEDGFAVVETKNGKTFININEGIVFPVRKDYYRGFAFADGLLKISENDKYGYINQCGQTIFSPIFDKNRNDLLQGFSNGYAWEKMNGRWGIIDSKGNITCDFKFETPGSRFDVNKISILTIDNRLYFVSPNGKMEIRNGLQGYYGGESIYIIKKDTGWGFQNINGTELYFDAVFDDIIGFDEGICIVEYQGRKGLVTKLGQYIDLSGLDIQKIYRFNSGRAQIITNKGTCGFIDETGNIVIDTIYDEYRSTGFSNGVSKVERYENRTGLSYTKKKISAYIDIFGHTLCDYEISKLIF